MWKTVTKIKRALHLHLSLNRESRWGTTDDFTTSFLHFPLPSGTLANPRPVHSLMLSSHFFRLLCLPPFIVPCKMVYARPHERETCPYHCNLRLFTMVRWSSCGPLACWILTWISSLLTVFVWNFFFAAELRGSMVHQHTGRWVWQGRA